MFVVEQFLKNLVKKYIVSTIIFLLMVGSGTPHTHTRLQIFETEIPHTIFIQHIIKASYIERTIQYIKRIEQRISMTISHATKINVN